MYKVFSFQLLMGYLFPGLIGLVLAGIYFYHHVSFTLWSILLVITSFFTPMFFFRTMLVKQTNQIANYLEEKYK